MAKRKGISKKIRFEVFKRDSFKCQYCGATAPEVILHVDHIKPVFEGGKNELLNYVTACEACNLGKGKRTLDDKTIAEKQKAQMDELNERRLQLEMMMKWREGLSEIDDTKFKYAQEKWETLAMPFILNELGIKDLKQTLKKFPLEVVLDAIETSCSQYLETDKDGKCTPGSVQKSFDYIGKICTNKKKEAEKPYLKDLYYIRGILKNRFNYINMWQTLDLLEEAYNCGVTVEQLKKIAKEVRNWIMFKDVMQDVIGG
jgi:hypothetical protein